MTCICYERTQKVISKKKYYYKNWNSNEAINEFEDFCIALSDIVNVKDVYVYNNFDNRAHDSTHNLVTFDKVSGDFIFGKVAPQQSLEIIGKEKDWNKVRKLFDIMKKVK